MTAGRAVPAPTSQRADTTTNKTIAAALAAGEWRIRQSGVGSGWGGELDGSRIASPRPQDTADAEAGEVTPRSQPAGLPGEPATGDGTQNRMICAGVRVEVDPPINRTDSAGRMWVVLPALLPRFSPGGGVASEAWVPA
jgi:hypothetical protein